MNRDLFAAMQRQMAPSPAARAALEDALAGGQNRQRAPAWRYAALATCALLLAAVWPIHWMAQEHRWAQVAGSFQPGVSIDEDAHHSYEAADNAAVPNTDAGGGEQEAASREEDVNTGDLPNDAPSQEAAVSAYQNLMARFEVEYGGGCYPAWYGGAYIDAHAGLIVNIVEDCEPDDKSLFVQIWDWAGSDQVGFGSAKYSLTALRDLQDRAFEAMTGLGLTAGCGVNEATNQVELELCEADETALRLLAELDPTGDAILVRVGPAASTDQLQEYGTAIQPGGRELPDREKAASAR